MSADIRPVADEEIYEVVRRRLFESLGDVAEHAHVADAYLKMFQQHKNEVPTEATRGTYKERLLAAYPFHPTLIDGLYLRWGSHSEFQRTRGVLRLLASLIGDLWQRRQTETQSQPLIQPCHIRGNAYAYIARIDGQGVAVATMNNPKLTVGEHLQAIQQQLVEEESVAAQAPGLLRLRLATASLLAMTFLDTLLMEIVKPEVDHIKLAFVGCFLQAPLNCLEPFSCGFTTSCGRLWMPAFAGMTVEKSFPPPIVVEGRRQRESRTSYMQLQTALVLRQGDLINAFLVGVRQAGAGEAKWPKRLYCPSGAWRCRTRPSSDG